MDERVVFLQALCEELKQLEADAVGMPEVVGSAVHAVEGQLRLSVEVHRDEGTHPLIAHVHVLAEIGEPGEILDACVIGMHEDRAEALQDAARHWLVAAGAPVLSMLHAKPVLDASHFCGTECWGVRDCHGFVGPLVSRFSPPGADLQVLTEAPLFEDVAELAPAGLIHIVKSTIEIQEGRWKRTLEIDGHSVSHVDHNWPTDFPSPGEPCICSRFAVFHYADRAEEVEAMSAGQAAIDRVIRSFIEVFQKDADLDLDTAMTLVERETGDRDLVHRVGVFAPLAFARVLFGDLGATFSREYRQVDRDGRVEEGVRLMKESVFARSTATAGECFSQPELHQGAKQLALRSPEVAAINDALHGGSRPEDLVLVPPLVFESGVDESTQRRVLDELMAEVGRELGTVRKKRWWEFWR